MKSIITIVVIFCLIMNSVNGQNIKAYFIPSNVNEEILYYKPDSKTGLQSEFSKKIKFENNGNDKYILHEDNLFQNNQKTSSETKMITVNPTEVIITKTSTISMIGGISEIEYASPQIFIKLPSLNNSESWVFENNKGEIISCSSEFTEVSLNGMTKNAIMVIRKSSENDVTTSWSTIIEYYVEDVGLWQITNSEGKIDYILKNNKNNDASDVEKSSSLSDRKRILTVYPKEDDLLGKVVFNISVDEDGNVIDIKLKSTNCDSCYRPAKIAIEQWKYEPLEGVGIQKGDVTIQFYPN